MDTRAYLSDERIKRAKVPVVGTDDEVIRVYFAPDLDLPPTPSVTVIEDLRVDPEKDEALEGWRERYDGQSSWARPWYKDQKVFKGYRGTLIHFTILSALGDASGDTYYHEAGEDNWGYEEYLAEYHLKKWSSFAPSANTNEVPYVPRNNEYDGTHAWDKTTRDMKWAAKAFKEAIIEGHTASDLYTWEYDGEKGEVPPEVGRLERDNVRAVEEYVYDEEYGYGGQFDLLYDTTDGRTVLADLKASSGIRFDHRLQSAAYKHAIEAADSRSESSVSTGPSSTQPVEAGSKMEIDQTEIIRLDPDREIVEVSRSDDWDRTLRGLEHEFLALVDRAHHEVYPDTIERAKMELMDEYAASKQSELSAVESLPS